MTSFIAQHIWFCRSPPRIPDVHIPEDPLLQFSSALRIELNRGFDVLRDIASGRDPKKFLIVSIVIYWSTINGVY